MRVSETGMKTFGKSIHTGNIAGTVIKNECEGVRKMRDRYTVMMGIVLLI